MSYLRVIPRDLFNEANLLKCIGALWIKTEGHPRVRIEHDGKPFRIEQSEADGSLTVINIRVRVAGRRCELRRPLNSREPWPLYLQTIHLQTEIPVFTDQGELSAEFAALIG